MKTNLLINIQKSNEDKKMLSDFHISNVPHGQGFLTFRGTPDSRLEVCGSTAVGELCSSILNLYSLTHIQRLSCPTFEGQGKVVLTDF